tara:strand:- start:6710 stop:7042 length:333 start_codon:yes stop_codon:yes gene_type:complete
MSSFSRSISNSQNDVGRAVKVITVSGAIGANDTMVFADPTAGAIALTLPYVADAKGKSYFVTSSTDSSSNNITINDAGDETGQNEITLNSIDESTSFYSNGLAWFQDIEG